MRYVCHELGHAKLAPTLVAGLAAIHREVALDAKTKKPRAEGEEEEDEEQDMVEWLADNLTALTAALLLYCVTAWRTNRNPPPAQGAAAVADSGAEERQFQADERTIIGVFGRVRGVVGAGDDDDGDDSRWAGWEDLQRRTFRHALVVVSTRHWLQSDWYQDIAYLRGDEEGEDGGGEDSEEEDDDEEDDTKRDNFFRTLHAESMLRPRYDLLSAAKQQKFEAWRASVLDEMAGLERPSPMEIDA